MGFGRVIAVLAASAWLVSAPGARAAWLETRVKSHSALIDVAAAGTATVSEELVLSVRGGPLKNLELAGADPDAELLPEASVTPIVRYGVPAAIPLSIARQDDGTLRIEIEREKGLFTGTYSFRFAYKTNLLARDRIRRRGTAAEVEWVGPRFADGIDVAKVTFRLPEGRVPPTLAQANDADDAALGSSFLSSMRHSDGKVELEVMRPHVARGEPAVWRVATDPKSFDGLPAVGAAQPAERAARVVSVELPAERAGFAATALGVALAYALLVWSKARLFAADVAASGGKLRSLVRLPLPLRSALAGASLGGAALLGALGDQPSLAGMLLLLAIALAWLRPATAMARPRGPGSWFVLTDAEAFARSATRARARWFDAGRWPGALVLSAWVFVFALGAALLSPHSPYHALALLLGSACLLPIYGSGRLASLPIDRVSGVSALLCRIKRELGTPEGAKVVAWARIPDGSQKPDELRLLVRLRKALDGLSAMEVGVELLPSLGGFVAEPFVLVRVREGSAAERAVPTAGVTWQRGRRVDERVAVLRPSLPSPRACAALAKELVLALQISSADAERRRSTNGESRFGVRSPAQAADAA
ncbi:MAG: hypothetical protein QM756_18790 [Polyangiaceae bacterium]